MRRYDVENRRPDFLLVTSRLSFEMVDKALVAGVGMLVGVSAPTTLAIDHAREHGLTLIALARSGRDARDERSAWRVRLTVRLPFGEAAR